ncbi:MAG: glycosyltransferase [Thermoplasmata archaeon]
MSSAETPDPSQDASRPSALVIVTHEKEPDGRLWASLPGQVDLLVVSDNSVSPEIQTRIQELCKNSPIPYVLIQNRANLGLARALNASVAAARAKGCRCVYFLDHDAGIDPDFFQVQRALLEELEREAVVPVGAVAPIVTDSVPSVPPPAMNRSWTPVGSVITSGILIRVSTFDAIGGFNESLFVEGVDFDFAARLRTSGRVLVRINRAMVRQQFGHPLDNLSLFSRSLQRIYAGFYYAGVLSGRSNSFHTRLSHYSVARRAELVKAVYDPRSAMGSQRGVRKMMQRVGLLMALSIDTVASRDRAYLRLALRAP